MAKLVADVDYTNPLTLENMKAIILFELDHAKEPLNRFELFDAAIRDNKQYRLGFRWKNYRALLAEMETEGSLVVRRAFVEKMV